MNSRTSMRAILTALISLTFALGVINQAQAQDDDSLAYRLANALPPAKDQPDPPQSFRVLCYHEIADDLMKSFDTMPELANVETSELIRQFSWLKQNGYHVVSMQQIIDARAGGAPLPDKAILITFDDGYRSVYTRAFPLLKLFNYPAVIGLTGSWLEPAADQPVQYGDRALPRGQFATWDQIRTMVDSGLVEVASHSFDLHKAILANPQGNRLAATITHQYFPDTSSYESDAQYASRIKTDLENNANLLEHRLGKRPRVMIWPFGRYSPITVRWAREAGMPITMNLEDGPNRPTDSLSRIRRTLLSFDAKLPDFIELNNRPVNYYPWGKPLERVVYISLDDIADPDPLQQEKKLSAVIDRIHWLKPTAVYLKAFSDSHGDGVADALYFPNRHLPVRSDLFSRIAWQLIERVEVDVYAWMPITAFKLAESNQAKAIVEIYEDLGKSGVFDGVLFDDSATSDDVDAFTVTLADTLRQYQPTLHTARNLNPQSSSSLFLQRLPKYLSLYDYTGIMMDSAVDPEKLLESVSGIGGALDKVVFEFPAHDTAKLIAQIRQLHLRGVRSVGYFMDDFARNQPEVDRIKPEFSVEYKLPY